MARILSRDRDKDPFNDDEAERRFLQSKPVCFIIFGKPGCGKTTLAKKLAKVWKCELVNGKDPLLQTMDLSTEMGVKAQTILSRGEALPEELASQILHDKIDSPEVAHHGYVLDGFPSLCEDWLSMKEQLELIKNWKYKPDFIINLKIPDRDLENRRINQRIDPVTNKIYIKEEYSPAPPTTVEETPGKDVNENADNDEEQGEQEDEFSDIDTDDDDDEDEGSKNLNDDDEDEGFPEEIFARLVVRPEDLPENVSASIKQYKDLLLRMLEDYMTDHEQQKLIEVDANLPAKAVFKAVMAKLNTLGLSRALTTLRLQGEDSEEISNDTDLDDMLRSLAAAEMVAPRFRWRRSRWGRLCPVELYNGNIVNGLPQFAVSFLDKIYCLSTSEALTKFIRNPRPYIMEPYPCPPCKICVVGPPCSGKTTLAKNLAQRYQAQYLDIEFLIGGTKQEAKKKLLEEVREEALEAAIAKVTVQIQLEREEEEERLAEEAEAKRRSEAAEDDGEEEEANDAGQEDGNEQNEGEVNENKVEEDVEKLKEEEVKDEEVKGEEEVKDEVVVDQNHPEVIKLVNEAMKEAENREAEISADEYVDVVEDAIQARLKEVEEAKAKGQRLGGYVLDNFPFTREQFTLLIERALIPDSVICLKDDSDNGSFLAKRWAELRRAEKYLPDIPEIDDKTEKESQEIKSDEPSKEGTTEESLQEETTKQETESTVKTPKPSQKSDTEEYQVLRSTFDNNWQQLHAIIKGTNNLEPIIILCDKDADGITDDAIKAIEEAFIYHPWEYTGMDEDEEEEDLEEEEEFDEEDENDVFNKDLGRKQFGDTKHYCPVMLKEKGVLWPGVAEYAAKYRERVYFFSSLDCRRQFLDDPTQYLPVDRPLKPPPVRLFIIGPKGCGKTLYGRYLAEKLGVFHIDFQERLQELIIAKTKKHVGPDYEDEDENTNEEGEKTDDSEGDNKEEEDMNLNEEEEIIYVSLTEGEHLQRDTVENILSPWWNEEPYRSRGFVLEGFPRNEDESRVLSMSGLFPDAAILLGVEDTDIIDRLLPGKLTKWKVKRDKRLAEKARQKEIALKAKEEARAKRKNELLLEMAERKAEKKARIEENGDEGDDDDDDEDDDEMDEADIEAILDGEFEEDDDLDDEEEETEDDAADRLRAEITDRFDDDNSRLGLVQDSLEEILIPRVEIDASRKPRIVRYCLDEALKPIVDFREALFSRCYSVSNGLAHRMLIQGYKFPSRFGKWCPVKLLEGDVIQPYYPRGTYSYPVIYRQYIYYLSSEKAKSAFMSSPMKYLKQPSPKPTVAIQMAIIGPPKSGKTTLANRFAAEYGVVRLSIGEVIRRLLRSQSNTDLVKQITHHLRTGCTVPDDLAVQALDVVLMDPQCQVKGFVLDGFPMTKHQIDLMTERSIIPVNVLQLCVDDDEVFQRATQDRRSPSRTYPAHDSHTIISIRLACWKREVQAVRAWYKNIQRNWTGIDGMRSKWLVWNTALDQAKRNIQDIQVYLVRITEGKAASIANMCVTPKEFKERLGDFGEYCPVSLADYGQLVDCSGNPSLEFTAEFRGRYYKMETAKELEKFLENPTAYVPPLALRALPPPDMLPKRRTATEMKEKFPCQIELQGYCPVTYLDGKKRYESILPGNPELVVEYRGVFYTFQSEKKLDAFMRTPEMYHGLILPRKLPPRGTPLSVHQLPMLGFLEQTVSEAITKALTAVGCFKPKYPFLTAKRSALLYVAYHLKAFNPKNSEYVRTKYKTKLKKFEEKCNLIIYLGRNMSNRYREPFQRPFDFDVKMKNFLELKVLRPTA